MLFICLFSYLFFTQSWRYIRVGRSKAGIEKGKDKANSLFAQGSLTESVRWFSKCIWLMESKKPADVPVDLQSILRSNRAFAYVKLGQWADAETDCSAALTLNGKNTKAKYRRAMARFELGKDEAALQDVEEVLKELPMRPSTQGDMEATELATELKYKISNRLKSAAICRKMLKQRQEICAQKNCSRKAIVV